MIRKFLLFVAATLASAACDTEEEPFRTEEIGYKGTLTVKSLGSDSVSFTDDDKNFDLSQDDNNRVALWMYDTQFVQMMRPMTMVVPGIAVEGSGERFALSGNSIIPYYRDGDDLLEMDSSRTITDLTGTVDRQGSGTLSVTFVCMGFQVTYNGTAIEKKR